jgi:hypothetical protein
LKETAKPQSGDHYRLVFGRDSRPSEFGVLKDQFRIVLLRRVLYHHHAKRFLMFSIQDVKARCAGLITVAAFMPVGFARSSTGEYAGGIFWIVGTAVLFSWLVSGLFTPYLAVKMLPQDLALVASSKPITQEDIKRAMARLENNPGLANNTKGGTA